MRIGLVSTYPPIECGIATYSQYLTEALKRRAHDVYVFSQHGAKGDYVFGVYSSQGKDIATNVFLMAAKMTPDIIHIQHEFGLYGQPKGIQVIELILRCKVAGLPVVTTFHTVADELTREEKIVLRVIVQESDAIIVHEEHHKGTLASYFACKDKVHVIPHGIRTVAPIPDARQRIGVEGKKVLLLCGYLRETKRFDRVVSVFPEVVEQVPDAVLVIAGKSRSVDHPEYQKKFYAQIDDSPVVDNIIVLHGQFPQPVFDTIISAADIVALPYAEGGQSGIMAHCFAFHKPVVTSALRAFENNIEISGGGLIAHSDEELTKHIVRLLKDDAFRSSLEKNIANFVREKTSWDIVAAQHETIYKNCAWRPTTRARFFG